MGGGEGLEKTAEPSMSDNWSASDRWASTSMSAWSRMAQLGFRMAQAQDRLAIVELAAGEGVDPAGRVLWRLHLEIERTWKSGEDRIRIHCSRQVREQPPEFRCNRGRVLPASALVSGIFQFSSRPGVLRIEALHRGRAPGVGIRFCMDCDVGR